jgi:hypothetical protein
MQYRHSLTSDLPSLSIPSRGTVRAFSRLCGFEPSPLPSTPSADFSTVFSAGCPTPSRTPLLAYCTGEISRGKTRILPRIGAGFTKCTHPSVAASLADGGLGGHVPARPRCITPHIRFLFIAPRFRLGLPPHPASRRRTCPLTNLRLCSYLVPGLSPGGIRAMHGTHVEVTGAARLYRAASLLTAGLGRREAQSYLWHLETKVDAPDALNSVLSLWDDK